MALAAMIRSLSIFAALPDDEIELLSHCFVEQQFQSGATLPLSLDGKVPLSLDGKAVCLVIVIAGSVGMVRWICGRGRETLAWSHVRGPVPGVTALTRRSRSSRGGRRSSRCSPTAFVPPSLPRIGRRRCPSSAPSRTFCTFSSVACSSAGAPKRGASRAAVSSRRCADRT
jgi:hypothetical protein